MFYLRSRQYYGGYAVRLTEACSGLVHLPRVSRHPDLVLRAWRQSYFVASNYFRNSFFCINFNNVAGFKHVSCDFCTDNTWDSKFPRYDDSVRSNTAFVGNNSRSHLKIGLKFWPRILNNENHAFSHSLREVFEIQILIVQNERFTFSLSNITYYTFY